MYRTFIIAGLALSLAGCSMFGKKAPEAPEVVIAPQPIQTCLATAELTRVVIPAKTETYIAITEIENPPYEPIQRRQELQREIEPERVIYTDTAGNEVTDICDPENAI